MTIIHTAALVRLLHILYAARQRKALREARHAA